MSIYLITNRRVANGKIVDKGKETAQRSFRVAECELDHANETVSYKLIPDSYESGYEQLNINRNRKAEQIENRLKGSARMFFQLYQQMLNSDKEHSDTLFFIHGFNYSLKSSLENIYELHKLYVEGESPIENIVYFSWPSIGHKFLTYWNDQEDAERSGKVLGELFTKLLGFFIDAFEIGGKERCQHKIHLAAHSMGNQVLKHMLESIPKHKLFPLFKEVILLNSDVEYDVFDEGKAFQRLGAISERTHMYIHRSDDALRISKYTKNFKQRLGFKGPKNRGALNDETFIVDTTEGQPATTSTEKWIDHWGYLHRPDVIADINHVLHGMDEDDIPVRKKWNESTNYFYFPKP